MEEDTIQKPTIAIMNISSSKKTSSKLMEEDTIQKPIITIIEISSSNETSKEEKQPKEEWEQNFFSVKRCFNFACHVQN